MDRWQKDMDRWADERRLAGAREAQAQINEKIAEETRESSKGISNFAYLLFVLAVIFFKPFFEYCIQGYNDLAALCLGVAAWFGF